MLARELTKIHETVSRGWISELLAGTLEERGEYVILVSDQQPDMDDSEQPVTDAELRQKFGNMTNTGEYSARDAVAALAEQYRVPKQRVYKVTSS